MNSSILTLFLVAVSAVGFSRADTATDDQVAARSDVIDLAGAFQNEGFKIRDGDWFGTISTDHPEIISVNLYSGNAYWFTVATTKKAEKIKLAVFDDQGRPVHYEPYESDNRAAAG